MRIWVHRLAWFLNVSLLSGSLVVGVALEAAAQRRRLTVERIASLPSLIGTAPSSPVWSPDSSRLAFLWNDAALPFRDVWVVDATGEAPARWTDMARDFPHPDSVAPDSIDALAARAAARARTGVSDLTWTPDGKALIFAYRGDLFRVQGLAASPKG